MRWGIMRDCDAGDFTRDKSVQTFEFALARRIVAQEFVGEAHCPQRQTYGVTNVCRRWRR